MLTIIYC